MGGLKYFFFIFKVLFAHSGLGGTPAVPRRAMAKCLVELLTHYPRVHGAAREALLTFCVSMEDAVVSADDDHELMDPYIKDLVTGDEAAITKILLDALLSSEPIAREAFLRALQHLQSPSTYEASARIWISVSNNMF